MSTVRELLEEAVARLKAAGVETPILDAELMMSKALGCSRTEIVTHEEIEPPRETAQEFRDWSDRRARREPLAYIIGEREFYGLSFEVTPAVLIPRPETEFLVDVAISYVRHIRSAAVADIGLGSGCAAIAIAAASSDAFVVGTESSTEALRVARRNAERIGVRDQVRFVPGDLLEPLEDMIFDVIVSNPPYVPSEEIDGLQPEIALYEPRQALDGGGDGLDVYRRLVPSAVPHLRRGGVLAVEVGIGQSVEVQSMFRSNGLQEVSARKDYSDIERIVIGERK